MSSFRSKKTPHKGPRILARRSSYDSAVRALSPLLVSSSSAAARVDLGPRWVCHSRREHDPVSSDPSSLESGPSGPLVPLPIEVGPYRLDRLIGQGGMGEVFEAFDRRLQRRVAIKKFKREAKLDQAHRERLLREARSGAQLAHPSIVQVFDILEHEGADWIVMELVEGETVAHLIKKGPLELARLMVIGRQVAEGLAEAHNKNLLHRDLKSENVMITATGRAKILDFGLAKRLDPQNEQTLTMEGQVMGTCRSMSPEQAKGFDLDARSDLFAFGTLLYEIATGVSPFRGPTPVATMALVCTHQQTPAGHVNPAIPEQLSSYIDHLLEKEPEDRPPGAEQVVHDLDHLAVELGLTLPVTASGTPRSGTLRPYSSTSASRPARRRANGSQQSAAIAPKPPWQKYLPIGAVVVVVIAALLLWRVERPRSSSARPAVAIIGFENMNRRVEFDWLAVGLTQLLASELGSTGQLRILDDQAVEEFRRELPPRADLTLSDDSLARVRSRLGADLVVLGSYLCTGPDDRVAISVEVQHTKSGEIVYLTAETSPPALLTGVASLGHQLRAKIGLPSRDEGTATLVSARLGLPSDPGALKAYSQGLEALRRQDLGNARTLLEDAVTLDPTSPLLHSALAEAWTELGYDDRAKAAADRALARSAALRREDRLLIEAKSLEAASRWDDAVTIYRKLYDVLGDDVELGLGLAEALIRAGRAREAIVICRELLTLPVPASQDLRIPLKAGAAVAALGEHREALVWAAEATKRAESQGARGALARARLLEANAHLRLGDHAAAGRALNEALERFTTAGNLRGQAETLNRQANLAFERGDFVGAGTIFQQVLVKARELGDRRTLSTALNNFADTQVFQGRIREALPSLEEALKVVEEANISRSRALYRLNLGEAKLRLGDLDAAEALATESRRIALNLGDPYNAITALSAQGRIQLARGQVLEAARLLESAVAEAAQAGDQNLLGFCRHWFGQAALLRGDLETAQREIEAAVKTFDQIGGRAGAAQARVSLAEVFIEQGDTARAEWTLTDARAYFDRYPEVEGSILERVRAAEMLLTGRQVEKVSLERSLAELEERVSRCQVQEHRYFAEIQAARLAVALERPADALRRLTGVAQNARSGQFLVAALAAQIETATLNASGITLEECNSEAKKLSLGLFERRIARSSGATR